MMDVKPTQCAGTCPERPNESQLLTSDATPLPTPQTCTFWGLRFDVIARYELI